MLSRRSFVAGLGALPVVARSARYADFDAVVVGAGAAGISAARTLQARGIRVLLLEARARLGGRAHTCDGPLGVPFDLGALWFHSAGKNPLAKIAMLRGIPLQSSHFDDIELRTDGSVGALNVSREIARGESRIRRKALLNVLLHVDRPLSAFATDPASTLAVEAEALQCASSAANLSIIDVARLDGGPNLIPTQGMGRFIVSLGTELDVRLNCRVERIDFSRRDAVRVSGQFGCISARTCIVTVPTSLLAKDSINFVPALPPAMRQHFADLPMGLMLKVGIGLADTLVGPREFVVADATGRAVMRIDGARRVVTVIASGDTAESVSAGGAGEKSRFARTLLRKAFGSAVPLAAAQDISSAWDADVFAQGSYAHVLPGKAGARRVYDMNVEQRIFFAGEAGGREYAMTVGGAWLSGDRAAHEVVRALGSVPAEQATHDLSDTL